MLSRTAVVVLILICAVGVCSAQSFTNLNFEQGVVQPQDPYFGFLDWSIAVPGWSHSDGADTGIVYYGETHFGMTQWFMLVDSNNTQYRPLGGRYSLAFRSGYSENSSSYPWVNASVYQTALIPSYAHSIYFKATGNFGLSVNGVLCPVIRSGSSYAADLRGYSGTVAQIRFTNMNQPSALFDEPPVLLDDIIFSSNIVNTPEPPSLLALSLGAMALIPVRRLRHRR